MTQIQHNYEVPFDSFEWKNSLHDILRDFFTYAAIKKISKLPEPGFNLEWKDDTNILRYAIQHNLLPGIMKEMEEELEANYLT